METAEENERKRGWTWQIEHPGVAAVVLCAVLGFIPAIARARALGRRSRVLADGRRPAHAPQPRLHHRR